MRTRVPIAATTTLLLVACASIEPTATSRPATADDAVGTPTYQPMLLLPMPDLESEARPGKPLQSIVGRDTPVQELLLTLFKDSDVNLLVDAETTGSLTFDIKNTTVEEAFEALLRSLDLAFEWDGTFLRVRDRVHQVFDVDLPMSGSAASPGGGATGGSGTQGGGTNAATALDLWSGLSQDLRALAGESQLLINASTGTVEIEAAPSVVERVRDHLRHAVSRATCQVSLEARILEVRLNDEFRLGVNWSLLPGFFNSDETGTLDGGAMVAQTAASGASALNLGFLNSGNFSVFVDALEGQGQVRVLSSPRVATLNNSPATIRVADQIPVIDREVIDSLGGLRTQFDIRFVDAGVSVDVTPQVGADGMITLQVAPRVTERTGTVVTPDGLQQEPLLSTRETTTSVRVADGQPIVIGGLRTTRKTEDTNGVPLLSSLPILGSLFRSTVQTREEVELLVVVIPRLLDDSWIDEDVRRGAHRLITLRRPFRLGSIDLEGFRSEDWNGGVLRGAPHNPAAPAVRHEGEGGGPVAASGQSLTITRKGLAGRMQARARDSLANGERAQAAAELERAIALDPTALDAVVAAAILHARGGDLTRARTLLARALRADEPQPLALAARGALEMMAAAPELARRYLAAAHQQLHTDWTAANLGAALLATGEIEAARKLLAEHASAASPPELLANLAAADLYAGDPDAAQTHLQQALTAGADPRNPRVNALSVLVQRAVRAAAEARQAQQEE